MAHVQPTRLDRPVDVGRDHVLGNPQAEMTLVEYGSYTCPYCHGAHEVIAELRDRFGERMRYVFRHRPDPVEEAQRAAELAEYAGSTGRFWEVHDALMKQGPQFAPGDFERIAREFGLPPAADPANAPAREAAQRRVLEDLASARASGVLITPTFFVDGRRYEGAWDAATLAEAMLGTLGHRLHAASVEFVHWGPSAGLLLLVMSIAALLLAGSETGPAFDAWWLQAFGFTLAGRIFELPVITWINDGLLSIFFLVVGLEIKREFTVGRLATPRAAALPVLAALGGIVMPVVIYLSIVPPGPLPAGWAVPISTDTAFAVALIVLLGRRVPVELRVFLTAAVIIDDLVAIAVIALFYTDALDTGYLLASVAVTGLLVLFNRSGIYHPLPYAVAGAVLWFCLHQSGLHATLSGVILAMVTPALPPANLRALTAQAEAILHAQARLAQDSVMRHGLPDPALRALDAIHDRIESPAAKLLRSVEPWSSYLVLPLFALANAGVAFSLGIIGTHADLVLGITLGLVLGKPIGILGGAWLAVRAGIAVKPPQYSWRQLAGAGAIAGIGFTMSLFIAGVAYPAPGDYAASRMAIIVASVIAGCLGTAILWPRRAAVDEPQVAAAVSGPARAS